MIGTIGMALHIRYKWFYLALGIFVAVLVNTSFYSNTAAQGTPTRTLTSTPTKTLAEQAGFIDARLKQLSAKGVKNLRERVDFKAYGHKYRLLSFDPVWQDSLAVGGTVLLYQADTIPPKLIWEQTTEVRMPFLTEYMPSPGDWFNDGTVRFGVLAYWWTTGWSSRNLTLYSLATNNAVIPVSMDFMPKGYEARSIEKQGDDTLLLVADDQRDFYVMGLDKWSIYMCCGPYLHRYYQWKQNKFVDVSANVPEKYHSEMGNALQYVTTVKAIQSEGNKDRLFALNLLRLLVVYENINERDAGWSLVQTLVSQARQSGRLPAHTYVDDVFLPWIEQLYKDNKPFVAPDCQGCQ